MGPVLPTSPAGPASLHCKPSHTVGSLPPPPSTKPQGGTCQPSVSRQTQRPGRAAWEGEGRSGGSQPSSWGPRGCMGVSAHICCDLGSLEGLSGVQPGLPCLIRTGPILSPRWRSLLASFNKTQIPNTDTRFQKPIPKKSEKAPQRINITKEKMA